MPGASSLNSSTSTTTLSIARANSGGTSSSASETSSSNRRRGMSTGIGYPFFVGEGEAGPLVTGPPPPSDGGPSVPGWPPSAPAGAALTLPVTACSPLLSGSSAATLQLTLDDPASQLSCSRRSQVRISFFASSGEPPV